MDRRFRKRLRLFIAIAFVALWTVIGLIAFLSPRAPDYLNDPTLVATKPPDYSALFLPSNASALRKRFYRAYREVFPLQRGTFSFPASAPRLCSIDGLLIECHEVSGVQFFIDKKVAGGSVMFGSTNKLNGPQWVAAFTNAVRTGEVQWWDPNIKDFRKENPVFIPIGTDACLVLPKERVEQYRKAAQSGR